LGNGAVYAADEGSTVTAIRAVNGTILWKAKIEGVRVEMTVVG
jgi:outer membrane protein assembly factor BamB